MEQENTFSDPILQQDSETQQPFKILPQQNSSLMDEAGVTIEKLGSEDIPNINISQLLKTCQFKKALSLLQAEFESKRGSLGDLDIKLVPLLNQMAEIQIALAQYYKASELCQTGAQILQTSQEDPDYSSLMAHTCQILAMISLEKQENREALDLINKSLALSSSDSLENIEKYRIKALILCDLQYYKEALVEIQRSLDLVDHPTNAIDDIIRARVYNTWGEIHSTLQDWKKVGKASVLAMEICQKSDLTFHIEMAKACQGAALCLMETEKSSPTVLSLVETSLMICDKSFGEDYHPLRVSGFLLLARYFKQQKDVEKMCEYIDLALTAGEVLYGDCEKTREVRLSAANVAGDFLLKKQLVSPIMKASVEGKDGQELVNLYLQKSDACLLCGDYKALDALIPQALTAICNISGERSLGMIKISERMIAFYEVTKQLKKRMECMELIVEMYQGLFGDNHIEIAKTYLAFSGIYLVQNMFSEAIPYLEQALKIQVEFYGELNLIVVETYVLLANVYRFNGDDSTSMKTHLKVLRIQEKIEDEKIYETYEAMGTLYAKMNDAKSSGDCFRKSYQLARAKFGNKGQRTLYTKEFSEYNAEEKDMLENTQEMFE